LTDVTARAASLTEFELPGSDLPGTRVPGFPVLLFRAGFGSLMLAAEGAAELRSAWTAEGGRPYTIKCKNKSRRLSLAA